ncbi:AraC family transcriptional regulator [Hungatella hathewayi]
MEYNYRMETVVKEGRIPVRIIHQRITGDDMLVSPHWHKDVELNLMLLNKGHFIIDGKDTEVNIGDVVIINSEVIHSGYIHAGFTHQELITILWDYDFFYEYFKDLPQFRFDLSRTEGAETALRSMIIEIALLNKNQNDFIEMRILSKLYEMGEYLLSNCLVKNEQYYDYDRVKRTRQIQEVIEYIETHYKEELTLEEIADKVHMAPTYFSRRFRQITGIRYYDCLIQCRIRHARDVLMNSNQNITEIAYATGFPNVKSFIEYFKKYYHTTPMQYKKTHNPS